MKRLLLVLAMLALSACARPGDHPVTSNCLWSEENNQSLDLTKSSDRHHLRFDAATAEDMSIRWTDQHFAHLPEYDQQQNQCIETLFHGVATQHGVDVFIVRNYSYERDVVVDAAAMISFGALYAAFA